MTPHSSTALRHTVFLLWLLIAAAFIGWTPLAAAATTKCTASSATLTLPNNVSILPNATQGPLPNTIGMATIVFTCQGLPLTTNHSADYTATIQAGQYLAPLDSTNVPAGPGITFKTNLTGIALLVKATPVQASSEACLACGPTSTAGYVPGSVVAPPGTKKGRYSGTVTAHYTAQLVKTIAGPVTPGTIDPINLIPFWWYIPGGSDDSISMSLNASLNLAAVTVGVPACTISNASKDLSVTLPSLYASELPATGRVAGRTAFSITVTGCPSGVTSVASYFSSTNIDTGTGNLKNIGSGAAANVEIQLLNGNGGSATPFSAINLTGTSVTTQNSGTYNVAGGGATLNYYAQYIANGAAAGTGSVKSSVMYTITYP